MRKVICLAALVLLPAAARPEAADEDDLAALREVVADPDEPLANRRKACDALAEARDAKAAGVLAAALGDEGLGLWAARALWRLGPAGQAAAKKRLADKDAPGARRFAALALSREGPLVSLHALLTGKD